ncbi:MAG: biopolymer transporter ExbD [Pirellulales bacterium]|nr:biopolymer transporter ExbD [Pirellulales bacterium]
MKIKTSSSLPSAETDMTPMIDMTFQLITFFMFVMRVSDIEASDKIKLPSSQIAKPPEGKPGQLFIVQMTDKSQVLSAGDYIPLDKFSQYVRTYVEQEKALNRDVTETVVLVRADELAKTGDVQEMIRLCQKNGLTNFNLRAVVRADN